MLTHIFAGCGGGNINTAADGVDTKTDPTVPALDQTVVVVRSVLSRDDAPTAPGRHDGRGRAHVHRVAPLLEV